MVESDYECDYKLYIHCNDPRLHDCYNKLNNPEL